MKKYFYILMFSFAAFMIAGCTDDITPDVAVVKSGQPISFHNMGNETIDNGKKKLHYGEKTTANMWPVCWDVNDVGDVLCPEARWGNNPHNEAIDVPTMPYKVTAVSGTSAEITAEGTDLCWGASNAHHFFQAFPKGTVKLNVKKDSFDDNTNAYSANFIANISQSQIIPADKIIKDENGNWTACDMNYAVLVGSDRYMRYELNGEDPIKLHYNTSFTAVEITIEATQDEVNNLKGDIIYSIDISNATTNNAGYVAVPLAGEFTGTVGYDENGKTYANNFVNSTTASNLFDNVHIDLSEKPVRLDAGSKQTLKVTAFLLPTANAQLKISINRRKVQSDNVSLSAPLIISKSFKSGAQSTNAIEAGKLNHIILGALKPGEVNQIDGTNWMSVLPDNTYLSQMSIPGVYDCGAYSSRIHGGDRAQMALTSSESEIEQMKAYLSAGDRIFDFKLNSTDGTNWTLQRQTGTTTQSSFSFEDMVKAAKDWLKEHQTECIICILSDYNTSKGNGKSHIDCGYYGDSRKPAATPPYVTGDYIVPSISYYMPQTYKSTIGSFVREHTPVAMQLDYTADVTIGEVRGKMVIINETAYENALGLCVTNPEFIVNTKPNNYTWYQDSRTIENEVALSEHDFGTGKIYIQDFLNLQRRGTAGTIKSGANGGNYNTDITKKKGYLDTAFESAKNDNTINHWYLISTAARGWVNSGTYAKWPTALEYEWAVEPPTTGSNAKEYFNLRNYVKDIVNSRSKTTYQCLGFVLSARVGQEAYNANATGMNRSLEQMIWENNYIGNGPQRKK